MDIIIDEADVNIFKEPARIMVAGMSNSGKSYLIAALARRYMQTFSKIIICSESEFPLEKTNPKIVYFNGIYDPFEEDENADKYEHKLIILDDMMLTTAANERLIASIFTRGRHRNVSAVYISQNLFNRSPLFRIISLNCNYFIITRCRDLNQLKIFARSFLQKEKCDGFVKVYEKYVQGKKYGYILIDFTQLYGSKLMFRTDIVGTSYEKVILI